MDVPPLQVFKAMLDGESEQPALEDGVPSLGSELGTR